MALGDNLKKDRLFPQADDKSQNPPTAEVQRDFVTRAKVLDEVASISETDLHGTIIYVNDTFCKVSGYTREELIGKPHNIMRHPDMSKSVFKAMWDTIQAGKSFKGQVKNKKKDGGHYWADSTISPVFDDEGNIVKYVAIRFNITAQKQQAEALENLSQRLELATESAEIGVWEWNIQTGELIWNKQMYKMYGVSEDSTPSFEFWQKNVHEDDREEMTQQVLKAVEDKSLLNHDFRVVTPNGEIRYIRALARVITDNVDTPTRMTGVNINITERTRKEQEQQLLQNELQARLTVLDEAALMSEADLYGNITYANKKLCEVSKYTEEELIGKPHNIIRHPDTPPEVFKEMWKNIQQGKIYQGEYKNRDKKDGYYWVDATIAPVLDNSGKPYKYIGVRFDITQRKEQEAQITKQLEEVEDAQIFTESLIASTGQMFIATDTVGNIKYWNDVAAKTLGYTQEEALKITPGHFHDAGEIAQEAIRLNKEYDANLAPGFDVFRFIPMRGEVYEKEWTCIAKNGRRFPVNLRISQWRDAKGHDLGLIAILRDITEEKEQISEINRLLDEAKEKESRLQSNLQIIEKNQQILAEKEVEMSGLLNAVDATLIKSEYTIDGILLHANENFLNTMEYKLEEVKDKHVEMFIPTPDLMMFRDTWRNLQAGKSFGGEVRRQTKTGKDRWFLMTYTPVRDDKDNIVKILYLANDITEQKLQDLEFQEQIEAVGRSNDVIEYGMDGTILEADNTFLERFGYTINEVKGKNHRMLCTPEEINSKAYQDLWKKLRNGEYDTEVYRRIKKDGSIVWYEGSYNPILDLENQPVKIVFYGKDVTDRRVANSENRGKQAAIDKSFAVAEFDMDGNILNANELFLGILDYDLENLKHKHHSTLCTQEFAKSSEYKLFWRKLKQGEFQQGIYKQVGLDGKEVWLQATYNPIRDYDGNIHKVVKYAIDITNRRTQELDNRGKQEALDRSYGAIEFDMRGNILTANELFLDMLGYKLKEVVGKHHSMLLSPEEVDSLDDREFWQKLNQGEFQKKVYKRITKDGSEVWLQATYNPVRDYDGNLHKVVKYALDMTESRNSAIENRGKQEAIDKSYAVVEYDLKGNILTANDLFLEITGYRLKEVIRLNHTDLCLHTYADSEEYREFWHKIQKGEALQDSYQRLDKRGNTLWLQGTYNPIRNYDGKIFKIVQYTHDITSQRVENLENAGKQEAIDRSYGIVEFDMNGTILMANNLYLKFVNYSLHEIQGKHHSVLCRADHVAHPDYQQFWNKLNRGEYDTETYKRIGKNGVELWLEGTYNPIRNHEGDLYKVVSYVQDVTPRRTANSENRGKLAAINKSFGSVEFDLDGTVTWANPTFLESMGYTLEELKTKHHRTLCTPEYANSSEYRALWTQLGQGEVFQGDVQRIRKDGDEVWFSATYNPIRDYDGNIFKIVKYAQNITDFKVSLTEASNFLDHLAQGNLDVDIELHKIKPTGDIAQMIQSNLSLRDRLRNIINELTRVAMLAGQEGRLEERVQVTDATGAWKRLNDLLNELLDSVSNPVSQVNELVSELAKGDLTNRFEEAKAKGDIQKMAQALNQALNNINGLLRNIEEGTFTLDSSAEQLLQQFKQMEKNTLTVVTEIQQISAGMSDQVRRTDESSKLVDGILLASDAMGTKSEIINRSAEAGMDSCRDGMSIIEKLVKNMSEIENSADSTSGSINVLAQRSEEISRTLNVINEIANQTNLLALNAAIEAARAGDAGRGFQVVAEEIRKLAERSKSATIEIEKVIKDVQKDVSSAGKAIDKMEFSVYNGNSATQEAQKVFETILSSSEETLNLSKDVLSASDDQKSAIQSIAENISQIVVVSEETATGTQNVTVSAKKLDEAVSQVAETGKSLASLAEELKDGVGQFKLN